MTIKDMEMQTGLARANIRYYEAEGLISPERAENGYREYSQEDAETLLRVKLLRALGLTVGQIKAIVRGETELDAALSARIAAIQKEKAALDRAGEIAGRLRQAHAQFRTLDARPYLDEMQTERVLERDTLPKEHFPWQRFFARLLDGQIYRTLWMLLLPALGFNMLKNSRGGMLFPLTGTQTVTPIEGAELSAPSFCFSCYAGNEMTSLSGGSSFGCFSSGCMALSTVPMSR